MKKVETFYRLTKQEKDRLVEQCRKEIEARKVREIEEVRKILEELLETKWEKKKKTAQTEMQKMLDDLQRQITEAQKRERQNSTAVDSVTKKLTAAEARNSELSGDLALANGKLNNSQDRLKATEEKVVSLTQQLTDKETKNADLQKKLTESEENAAALQKQLKTAEDSNDTLRRLYTASENTLGKLRKTQSESEAQIRKLEEDLEIKTNETKTSAAEAKKHQKEVETLEKLMEKESKEHEVQKSSAWRGGCFLGVLLAAVLCVVIFPTHYIIDSPVSAGQDSGVSETYSGGVNMFDRFSGFGELCLDDGTVCTGFWASGLPVFATEYIFPNGGVFCGSMSPDNRPMGAGTYTRLDGEKVFGLWSWAREKTVKVGASDAEYIYTGPLRFGEPYGYGTFEGNGEENRFVGEYYDDIFRNGMWIEPDGTPRKVNSQ